MNMNYGSFRCAICHEDFDRGLNLLDTVREYRKNFPGASMLGSIEICRQCFNRYRQLQDNWQPPFNMLTQRKIEQVRKRQE